MCSELPRALGIPENPSSTVRTLARQVPSLTKSVPSAYRPLFHPQDFSVKVSTFVEGLLYDQLLSKTCLYGIVILDSFTYPPT